MVSADAARERALHGRRIGARAESDCVSDHASERQSDRAGAKRQRSQSKRGGSTHDLCADRDERQDHDGGDRVAHRLGERGDAPVVAGDRGQHVFGQVTNPMAKNLHVEHEIHPQDREQEAASEDRDLDHRPDEVRLLVATMFSRASQASVANPGPMKSATRSGTWK